MVVMMVAFSVELMDVAYLEIDTEQNSFTEMSSQYGNQFFWLSYWG